MKDLSLIMPVAIGGVIWSIDFPKHPFTVIGYRIGRMMGEDTEDYEEDYEGREGELHIQYESCGISGSEPVSSIGTTIFLTRDEAIKVALQN